VRCFLREAAGARELKVVGFGWGERARALRAGQRIDAVLEPRINRWNGAARVEAELRDLRVL
jgi:hypothetical protein